MRKISLPIDPNGLFIHIVNEGDGECIIIELPVVNYERNAILIDSYNADKTLQYLDYRQINHLALVVLTHPHIDHYNGLEEVIMHFNRQNGRSVQRFWDSGFNNNSQGYSHLIDYLRARREIEFTVPTSGTAIYIGRISIQVLAPSIYLRNRFYSTGTHPNNASIVLKISFGQSSAILSGDAQWDSWARLTDEFPPSTSVRIPGQLLINHSRQDFLRCQLFKIAHHGSKHGTSLEVVERLRPRHAIFCCGNPSRHHFPHQLTEQIFHELPSTYINSTQNGSWAFLLHENGNIQAWNANDSDPRQFLNPDWHPS